MEQSFSYQQLSNISKQYGEAFYALDVEQFKRNFTKLKQASGLPPVTSNAQGMKECVINSKNGFWCSLNDVEGYAEGLKQRVEASERRHVINSENIVAAKKYDYENTKEQIFDTLTRVLSVYEV